MKMSVVAILFLFVCPAVLFSADLQTYQATYEREMKAIVVEQGVAISQLNESYSKALNSLSERATGAGDLDGARAVMSETERFAGGNIVQLEDTKGSSPDLKSVQLSYLQQRQYLKTAQARSVVALASKYDSALSRLQTSLTRQRKLDAGLAVQNERRAVASRQEVVNAGVVLSEIADISKQPIKVPAIPRSAAQEEKVWLFEMEPIESVIGWGKLGLGSDSGRGAKCILKEKVYEKSVSAHAFSKLRYEIPKNAKTFCFGYGINYDAKAANCEFIVRVDERKKFSKKVEGNPKLGNKSIALSIGAKELTLVVDSLGSQYNDHAVWVDPYFVLRGSR